MSHQNCLRFNQDIAYDLEYNGAVDDSTEGQRISQAFGRCSTLFHRSHGTFVLGSTIAKVTSTASGMSRLSILVDEQQAWKAVLGKSRSCQSVASNHALSRPLRLSSGICSCCIRSSRIGLDWFCILAPGLSQLGIFRRGLLLMYGRHLYTYYHEWPTRM